MVHPATGQVVRPRYEYRYDPQGNQTLLCDPLLRETRFTVQETTSETTGGMVVYLHGLRAAGAGEADGGRPGKWQGAGLHGRQWDRPGGAPDNGRPRGPFQAQDAWSRPAQP